MVSNQFPVDKSRTRDQIANICWIIEKTRESQKNIYFCFTDYAKGFDCVDHNTLWKILQEMGIPDHLTCLLRNLHAGQEATVRTRHETTDWFKILKRVHHGCILSRCLLNLYAEYIIRNTGQLYIKSSLNCVKCLFYFILWVPLKTDKGVCAKSFWGGQSQGKRVRNKSK